MRCSGKPGSDCAICTGGSVARTCARGDGCGRWKAGAHLQPRSRNCARNPGGECDQDRRVGEGVWGAMTSAVLLLAHGTPNVLGEMAEYLSKVTGGRKLPDEVVEELKHRYAQIGLGETPGEEAPPLTKWTVEQGRLLEEALGGTKVYVAMRNWHPYIADVAEQMRADGVTQVKAICLAPQNSRTSVG